MKVKSHLETELKDAQEDTRLAAQARNLVLDNGDIASLVKNLLRAVISGYKSMNMTFI